MPSLLYVEDNAATARATLRLLRRHYDVHPASDGSEAISMLEKGLEIDVILTDLHMPVSGRALFGWLVLNRPELASRTVFLSGCSDEPDLVRWYYNVHPLRRVTKGDDFTKVLKALLRARGSRDAPDAEELD
jgi:CheY-like chemotaxis protein